MKMAERFPALALWRDLPSELRLVGSALWQAATWEAASHEALLEDRTAHAVYCKRRAEEITAEALGGLIDDPILAAWQDSRRAA